jgi:hypothetical protein
MTTQKPAHTPMELIMNLKSNVSSSFFFLFLKINPNTFRPHCVNSNLILAVKIVSLLCDGSTRHV